ncbi:MAG TPA: D-alanyl-D-alanine carboxypeptidase family protein [Terriglobales bacterium]|nr:D-alanyl-D-alanine carboxypeptidase family protein [Terriglobales bacterium]
MRHPRKGKAVLGALRVRPAFLYAGIGTGLLGIAYLLRRPLAQGASFVTDIAQGEVVVAYDGGVPIGTIKLKDVGNGVQLEESVADKYLAMAAAAAKDGITLTPVSGFRSMTKQTALWTAAVAKGTARKAAGLAVAYSRHMPGIPHWPPTAPPGFSNHQRGHAIDIAVGITSSQLDAWKRGLEGKGPKVTTKIYEWLEANAGRFGFKRLASEPWHFSTDGR